MDTYHDSYLIISKKPLSVERSACLFTCSHVFTAHSTVIQGWLCCICSISWSVKVLFCLCLDWRERMSVRTTARQEGTPVTLTRTIPPSGSTTT